jgi:hypothetical protein
MAKNKIAQELGRSGGKKTLKKYGTEHYKRMINKRWDEHRKRKNKDALDK